MMQTLLLVMVVYIRLGAAEPGASTTDRLVIDLIQILDKPNIFTLQLKVLLLTHSVFEKSNH